MNPLPPVRRVVTGHTEEGLGKVAIDEAVKVEQYAGGGNGGSIWITNQFPDDTNNDEDGATRKIEGLVMEHGSNLRVTDVPPGGGSPWHRTESVDYNILMTGTMYHMTNNGDEVVLHAGDVVVQRGSMHKWENRSTTEWARLISVLLPATPRKVGEGEGAKLLKQEFRM